MRFTRHAVTVVALLSASSAAAQQIAAKACVSGNVVADLGYDGTSCVNCTVYNGFIEYLTEPSVSQIREGGPADGKLRENDVLVAIDGSLITTRAAWRKMRSLTPGEPVTLTVRRNGSEREVIITPDSRCASSNEVASNNDDDRAKEEKADRFKEERLKEDRYKEEKYKEDRFKDEKLKEDKNKDDWFKEDRYKDDKLKELKDERSKDERVKELSSIVIDGKQVIVAGQNGFRPSTFGGKGLNLPNVQSGNPRAFDGPIAGRRLSASGWIGIGLECSRCTPVTLSEGRYRWRFEDPPSVVEVVSGSPAARAGLRSGDLILQIDGVSLTSVEGGRRWGDIRPGDEMSLTVRRGLQRQTVTVQAEERPSQPGAIARDRRQPQVFGLRPGVGFGNRFQMEQPPQPPQPAQPAQSVDGDRYYVGGAMVDLKGRATSVQYDRTTGELVIVGPDFTVRVRPREN